MRELKNHSDEWRKKHNSFFYGISRCSNIWTINNYKRNSGPLMMLIISITKIIWIGFVLTLHYSRRETFESYSCMKTLNGIGWTGANESKKKRENNQMAYGWDRENESSFISSMSESRASNVVERTNVHCCKSSIYLLASWFQSVVSVLTFLYSAFSMKICNLFKTWKMLKMEKSTIVIDTISLWQWLLCIGLCLADDIYRGNLPMRKYENDGMVWKWWQNKWQSIEAIECKTHSGPTIIRLRKVRYEHEYGGSIHSSTIVRCLLPIRWNVDSIFTLHEVRVMIRDVCVCVYCVYSIPYNIWLDVKCMSFTLKLIYPFDSYATYTVIWVHTNPK